MTIPCNECLVYPICKNKKYIKCSLLFDWMDNGSVDKTEEANKYLPKWLSVGTHHQKISYRRGRGNNVYTMQKLFTISNV